MLFAFLLVAGCSAANAPADSWARAKNRVFAAPSGLLGVKVLVGGARFPGSELVAFRLDPDGAEQVIWRKMIGFIPHQLIVSETGVVFGIDEYARLGFRHAVAVWSPTGEKVADHALEALLETSEITAHVRHSVSSRWWTTGADLQARDDLLRVKMPWGLVLCVDGRTGAVWRDFDPDALRGGALRAELQKRRAGAASQAASAPVRAPATKPATTP